MIKKDLYMNLKLDLSGARTKNRFRSEIMWGLKKIYEIYKECNDFCVIFDYKCDIEVHKDEKLEFYQIKTQNPGANYTLNKILKKNKVGESILGKLYCFKKQIIDNGEDILIAIVSNVPFADKDNKKYNTLEKVEFDKLSETNQDYIREKLQEELNTKDIVNLNDVLFIYTNMNLQEPENDCIGATVNFFSNVKGSEPIKPKTLYSLIYSLISEKACYELECTSYEDVKDKKGITKEEIDMIINKHIENSDESVLMAKEFIKDESNYTYMQSSNMIRGLARVVSDLLKNYELQELEKRIYLFIDENKNKLDITKKEIIEIVFQEFKTIWPIEYNEFELKSLIVLVLMRNEEGIYEKFYNK